MLHQLRWRKTPVQRGRTAVMLALVFVLHGLFVFSLWHEMRPRPPRPQIVHMRLDGALQVRFVSHERSVAPPAPAPVAPALAAPLPRVSRSRPAPTREPVRRDAMSASVDAVPAAASSAPTMPRLYDMEGGLQLPPSPAATAARVPGYVQRKPTGDMQVMDHTSPLRYKATRFEQYFPPPGENVAEAGLRHVVQALHGKGPSAKTVSLPHGVHLKCKTLLGIPTPFCGLPPAPPPSNDGDERLNMAPVAPLAPDPHPPTPPTLATCIAAYRAEGPLPYGCPVDTPARAVDAEIRECVALFRAGKRLKTWCPADTPQRAARPDAPAASAGSH